MYRWSTSCDGESCARTAIIHYGATAAGRKREINGGKNDFVLF